MKQTVSRRKFLKTSALAALGGWAIPNIIPARVLGLEGATPPSEKIGIGLIGCGQRMSASTADYAKPDSTGQVVAVCDPIRERRLAAKKQWGNCADDNDFRELLRQPGVDAVHIATADHWHVPIALCAAKAGKDIYVEKPLGISIEQDLLARQLVDKYQRVVQYGTQNRFMAPVRLGLELVLNGHIGDVKEVYVWCLPSQTGGDPTPMPVPDGYDFDLWLGPAPEAPFCKDRNLVQKSSNGIFHIYDYSLGFIAGWGAHPLDQLQWWADHAGVGIPVHYEGAGKVGTGGLFKVVTNFDVTASYANGVKLRFVDVKTAVAKKIEPIIATGWTPAGHGTLFIGTAGTVAVSRSGWRVGPETIREKAKDPGPIRLRESKSHVADFLKAVKERTLPVSNLPSAVRSDTISHLSDIAIRLGRPVQWDPVKETIAGDADAVKMMSRPMREPYSLATMMKT